MHNNGALCCNRIDFVVVPPIKHFFAKKTAKFYFVIVYSFMVAAIFWKNLRELKNKASLPVIEG